MMLLSVLLPCNNRVQIYIFHTLENIPFHIRIYLLQSLNQLLDLNTLRTVLVITSRTGIREFACTLDKMQTIIVPPCLDIILTFKYGVPPHAGLAYGLDRLVMLMAKQDSIRDVIAFPKVKDASCLMTNAPDYVDEAQLKELGIDITVLDEQKTEE